MPAAAAVITAGSAAYQYNKQKKAEKAYKDSLLTYDEAMDLASQTLNPIYDKNVTQTLNALDKGAISRGFYGQAPADAFKRSTAAQIRADQSSAVARLGAQMQGQSAAQAAQMQQLALQQAQQAANERYQKALATLEYDDKITSNPWDLLSHLGNQFGWFGSGNQSGYLSGNLLQLLLNSSPYQNYGNWYEGYGGRS